MKKYSFLVFHEDYSKFLQDIRDLGVVHVASRQWDEKQGNLESLYELARRYDHEIRFLKRRKISENPDPVTDTPLEILENLEALQMESEENEQKISSLTKDISKLAPWGSYRKDDIDRLQDEGYKIQLFSCPARRYDTDWENKYIIQQISEVQGILYLAVVAGVDEEIDIDAEPESMSARSLDTLRKELDEKMIRIEEIKAEIDGYAEKKLSLLVQGKNKITGQISYNSTLLNTDEQADGSLKILEGWVPDSSKAKLEEYLDQSEAYYFSDKAAKNEKPPILLENNRYARLFEPIGKLFGFPDYREVDLTPFFGPFFMLFFGFCLGDAGYGLFFILVALLLRKKVQKEMRPILTLGLFLGIATVFFGALSGTFFGINLIDSGYTITDQTMAMLGDIHVPAMILEKLESLKGEYFVNKSDFVEAVRRLIGDQALAEYRMDILKNTSGDYSLLDRVRPLMQDPLNMFYLSMIIGGIQIIFGKVIMIFNIIRQKGLKYSLSTMGWVLMILTLVVFMGGEQFNLINAGNLGFLKNGLMIASAALIMFFNNPDSNIFLRPLAAIWDAYGMVTGIFQDLLSYIRLFALGISSSILGFVFNDISSQLLGVPFVGWLLFVIMLLFGHSINLFLAALGAFIHPMRLTFVEFYKNAGFTGGGKEYKPFSN